MANYLPFNSIDHDRVYKAEDWAWYFSTFIGNGVFPKPTNGLMVMANGAMDVAVKAGFGFINGYAFRNQDDHVITIAIGDGSLGRIDRVVLRWDLTNRQMVLDVLQGTPSADPQPVALTRTADTYELALADISVTKGMTTISQANITDRRTNTDLCGIVEGTVSQIDWATLAAQLDAFMADYKQQVSDDFEDWWDGVKDLLDPEPAGQLALAIQRLRAQTGIPDVYDPERIYEPKEYCIYDNTLQKCTTETIGGGFDAGYWRATTVIKEIELSVAEAQEAMKADIGEDRERLDGLDDLTDILTHHGAGLHNALYRGKYLGDSLTAAQSAAIRAGTFEDLYIGDYWTIGGVNYRIADFDYFYRAGDTECTTHHVVIVPDTNLDNQKMNDTNVTTGGYTGSKMYTDYMATAKNKIIAAFGSGHILNHREYLTNAVANGRPSGGAWFDSTIELMSEAMCYGGTFFEPVSDGSTVPAKYSVACKQLNLFRHRPDMISNRQTFWLRNVVSVTAFASVSAVGDAQSNDASYALGVRPAFCIY